MGAPRYPGRKAVSAFTLLLASDPRHADSFALPTGIGRAAASMSIAIPAPPSTAMSMTNDGGLTSAAAGSLLNDAFANLSAGEQYDAVLTGLCAKILDGDAARELAADVEATARVAAMNPTERAFSTLADPLSLLEEMNGRRVRASPRSVSALIDAATTTENSPAMASVLSLAAANKSLGSYGNLQGAITTLPSNPSARVVCPDGKRRTRAERLEILPPVPVDERAKELTAALVVTGVLSLCLIVQSVGGLFGMEDLAGPAGIIVGSAVTVGIVDNFYDAIKTVTNLAVSTQKEKMPDAVKDVGLPDKESVPLGLGTGMLTGTIVRGLTRLLSVDTERECQCEAAAFFAAYGLGLPCFAFRPNALEGAILVLESAKDDDYSSSVLAPLLSDVGILKVLIWIMAPVAMEGSKHAQLIASDPREGAGLLKRLKERSGSVGAEAAADVEDILRIGDGEEEEEETDALLRWAYAEADAMLRENRGIVQELTERLAGGAATIGDCVAVIEGW